MYKISKSVFLYVLTASLLFISCKSLRPPKTVPAPLNYTDNDIVKIEIDRINKFLETEPVRALWRACLLGNEEIVEKCRKAVELRLEVSLEEREYLDTRKYYKSLMSAFPGWKHEKYSLQQIEEMAARDVPALSGTNKKAPAKIADCMQATVTIWVDRGIKVQAGAGYADIIIGSGFFIDERGYIVTNHHVIESMVDPKYEGYSRLYIKLLNDSVTKIPARVVGYDPVMDLALLKVEIVPDFRGFNRLSAAVYATAGTRHDFHELVRTVTRLNHIANHFGVSETACDRNLNFDTGNIIGSLFYSFQASDFFEFDFVVTLAFENFSYGTKCRFHNAAGNAEDKSRAG